MKPLTPPGVRAPWLNRPGYWPAALNALLLVLFFFFLANLFFTKMWAWLGFMDPQRQMYLIWLIASLRMAIAVPWRRILKRGGAGRLALAGAMFFVALGVTNHALTLILPDLAQQLTSCRIAFKGMNDDQIMAGLTYRSKVYPSREFVEKIRRSVPPNEGVAYIGSQRGHVISYLLYPRKVYQLPQLQEILLKISQNIYIEDDDPLHGSKANGPQRPEGYASRKTRTAFEAMLKERNIHWAACFNDLYPEKSWVRKIR